MGEVFAVIPVTALGESALSSQRWLEGGHFQSLSQVFFQGEDLPNFLGRLVKGSALWKMRWKRVLWCAKNSIEKFEKKNGGKQGCGARVWAEVGFGQSRLLFMVVRCSSYISTPFIPGSPESVPELESVSESTLVKALSTLQPWRQDMV